MIVYVNGEFVPAAEASISIFDRGLLHGDAVFDTSRTFGGRPFRVDEHLERLRKSLKYISIEAEDLIVELRKIIDDIVDRNHSQIIDEGDMYVIMIVTRGLMSGVGFMTTGLPTRIIMVKSLDFAGFGPLYDRGVELTSSLLTSHFAGAIDPRVKTTSKGAAARAELKAQRLSTVGSPGAWIIMFNQDGSIGESHASNICLVSKKRLVRPPRYQALEGVSLETLCELAPHLGLHVEERPIYLYDLINADEVFITGTSYCVLPVVSVDGIALDNSRAVYRMLLESWRDLVGFDFVAQAHERATTRATLVTSGDMAGVLGSALEPKPGSAP